MGNQSGRESDQDGDAMGNGVDNPVDVLEGEEPSWSSYEKGDKMPESEVERQDSRAPLRDNEDGGETIVDLEQPGVRRNSRPESGGDGLVCGVGSFRPRALQWVAGGPKAFAFWSTLYLLLKTACTVYIGSVIGTIEKQFKLSSVESGAIIILNDALDLALVMVVSYYGHWTHRPRLMAFGILLSGAGIAICAVPHFLLPTYTGLVEGCPDSNGTVVDYCRLDPAEDGEEACQVEFEQPAVSPVWWLILGQVLLGIGNVPIKPLGTTYIDDAVGKHTTALYMAFFFIAISIGPLLGFLFGSLFLSFYVDFDRVPVADRPDLDSGDVRFIGAWWLGFLCLGLTIMLVSVPFFFFPRFLPKTKERTDEEKEKASEADEDTGIEMKSPESKESNEKTNEDETAVKSPLNKSFCQTVKDMAMTYKVLLFNFSLLFLCLSSSMEGANAAALGAFSLKYYNVQFGVSGSMASLLAIAVFPFNLVGCLIGGYIIRRFKLSPAKCALFLIFGDVVSIVFVPFFLTLGCETQAIAGVTADYAMPALNGDMPMPTQAVILPDSIQQAKSFCNLNCTCGGERYNPVCGSDGLTYVSPCYAGCELFQEDVGEYNKTTYSSCGCIDAPVPENATAVGGECAAVCQDWQIPVLITISIIIIFCSGLGQTGMVLITLRIVQEDMRSAALGFQSVFLNLIGFFPAPVYFGALINAACILWEYENGDRGACFVYDRDKIRHYFHGMQGMLKVLASLLFLCVYMRLRTKKDKKYEPQSEKTNGQLT